MFAKRLLVAGFACASFSMAATATANEMPDRYFYIGGHISENFKNINDRENSTYALVGSSSDNSVTLPGAQLGYRFNQDWSVQAWWERRTDRSLKSPAYQNVNISLAYATLRKHFGSNAAFEPYAGIGVGEYRTQFPQRDDLKETVAGLEAGFQSLLHPNFLLDIGVRPYHSFRTERWDAEVYAGLNFLIGARKAAEPEPEPVEEVVLDSDGDGVPDYRDLCPNTPAGVAVDSDGCPIDSDGDGVPDYLDQCPNTPAGALVDETGCQVYLEQDIRETLYVEFGLNKAEVRQTSYPELGRVAENMRKYSNANLVLEGHTDSTGAASYNKTLSGQRAEAVKKVLVEEFGVDADRITTVAKGEESPIADNSTSEGRAQNRRVEAILEATKKEAQFQ